MSTLIPSNLLASTIASGDDGERKFVLRSSAGGEKFTIRYFGAFFEQYGLIVADDKPSLVIATAVDTGDEITIFDGAAHGYNNMFVDLYDAQAMAERVANTVFTHEGVSDFGVEIVVFDNIDWDEEEGDLTNDEGQIQLIDGHTISSEQLRADGFDAIGIDVLVPSGQRVEILNESLA